MFNKCLGKIIDIDSKLTYKAILEKIYETYEAKVKYLYNEIDIKGIKIFFPLTAPKILGKDRIFWHITGFESREISKINTHICNSDERSYSKCRVVCNENCRSKQRKYKLDENTTKHFCIYRAIRVVWIPRIIQLYNEGDSRVRGWYNYQKDKKGNKRLQFYIRFIEGLTDYIIIFEAIKKEDLVTQYKFVTAFPVFFLDEKDRFDKSFNNQISLK
ncbi:MAG: hypothetical protein SOY04_02085 [Clostridium celatum]|nr:hypothetical protein [Clostridium celatum]